MCLLLSFTGVGVVQPIITLLFHKFMCKLNFYSGRFSRQECFIFHPKKKPKLVRMLDFEVGKIKKKVCFHSSKFSILFSIILVSGPCLVLFTWIQIEKANMIKLV